MQKMLIAGIGNALKLTRKMHLDREKPAHRARSLVCVQMRVLMIECAAW